MFKSRLDILKQGNITTKKEVVKYMKQTRDEIQNGTFEDYGALIKQHVHKIIVHNDYEEIILTTLSKEIYDKYGNFDLDAIEKTTSDSSMSAPQDIPLSLVNLSKCLTLTLILYKGQKTAILQK